MSKKVYVIIIAAIVVLAIVTTVIMHKKTHVETKEVDITKVPTEDTVLEPVPDDKSAIGEIRVIKNEDLPGDLDVSQSADYIQQSINYDGISITVTEDGFTLSDDFVWTDDTYWYDVDPEGFARYSYLYFPDYGDGRFEVVASDSLNKWAGENTDVTYCMAAALDTKEEGTLVTWYVVFKDYPDMLVKATYDTESEEFSYERLF